MRLRGRFGTFFFALSIVLNALSPGHALAALVPHEGFAAADFNTTAYPSSSSIGPLGLDFDAAGNLFAVDRSDNSLYRVPAGGGAPVRVGAALGPAVSGLAFSRPNYQLYVATGGTMFGTTRFDVVQVDPATGAPLRGIARDTQIPGPAGIATDPVSGDLFVAGGNGYLYRIRNPETSASVSAYREVRQGNVPLHAVAVASDRSIFVSAGAQVFRVPGVGQTGDVTTVVTQDDLVGFAIVAGASGTQQVPRFIYANRSNGTITKIDILQNGRRFDVLTGGSRGDYAVVGPDRCLYATQSSSVLRVEGGFAGGLCDLALAGEAAPFLELSSSGPQPRVGSLQTVTAIFGGGVGSVSGVLVAFSWSGANTGTANALTDAAGVARLTYSGENDGTDTITAVATYAPGRTVTSAAVSITWLPALDTTGPTITPTVRGTPSTKSFACSNHALPGEFADPTVITDAVIHCGYYTSPPSVEWHIADPDGTLIDLQRTGSTNCPNYPAAFTLVGNSPPLGTPVTCHAWNVDGGDTVKTVVLNAIVTPPVVTATRTPTANTAGWNRDTVTVRFSCVFPAGDLTRDPAFTDCSDKVVSGETSGTTVTGFAEDVAGNRTELPVLVKIDRTPPTLRATATAGGAPYAGGTWTDQSVTVRFEECADLLSGIAFCPPDQTFMTDTASGFATGTARDNAGNTASASFSGIQIDKTRPTLTVLATKSDGTRYAFGTPTNRDVTLDFSCSDGSGSGVVACPPSQTFSAEGEHIVSGLTVTDRAGNTSAAFAPRQVVIDKTPPTVEISATAGGAAYTSGTWTRHDVELEFECSADAACPGDAPIDDEGTQTVTTTVVDEAGNESAPVSIAIAIDKTPPVTTATLSTGRTLNNTTVTVSLAASDGSLSGVSSITYTVGGATTTVLGTTTSVLVSTEGETTVRYFATDVAGNEEAERPISFTIDLTKPTISASGSTTDGPYVSGTWTSQDVTVHFECADDEDAALVCPEDELVDDERSTTLSRTVTDAATNESLETTFIVQIDRTPPTLSANATTTGGGTYVPGRPTNRSVTLTFACADPGGSGVAACPAAQTFSADGTYDVGAQTVTDRAGNESARFGFGTIVIDREPPTITASASTASGTYVSGTWTNQVVTVEFTCSADVAASCPDDVPVDDEETQTVNRTVTDAAGNSATASFAGIRVDTSPPTITATATRADGDKYEFRTTTNGNVTVHFACPDGAGSGVAACPGPQTFVAEGTFWTDEVVATDVAGNSSDPQAFGPVLIDLTPPEIGLEATAGPAPYPSNTWTNRDVRLDYTCTGEAVDCPADETIDAEGTTAISRTVHDAAGNESAPAEIVVRIDKTAPTLAVAATTVGGSYSFGTPTNGDVTVQFTCADGTGSGVAGCPGPQFFFTEGVHGGSTVTVTDRAGNPSEPLAVGEVLIDRTGPTTTATPTGLLVGGTYLGSVQIALAAADPSGVSSITYRAEGVQPIAPTTVSGAAASVLINAVGTTSLFYAATDQAGNVEFERILTVAVADVVANACGKLQGEVRFAAARLHVDVKCDGGSVIKGQIQYQLGKAKITVKSFSGFTLSSDRRTALVQGTTTDGRPVTLVLEFLDVARLRESVELRVAGVTVAQGIVEKNGIKLGKCTRGSHSQG